MNGWGGEVYSKQTILDKGAKKLVFARTSLMDDPLPLDMWTEGIDPTFTVDLSGPRDCDLYLVSTYHLVECPPEYIYVNRGD